MVYQRNIGMQPYIRTVSEWVRNMLREPHEWLAVSFVFVILSIPVLTAGAALLVGLEISKKYVEGYGVSYRKDIPVFFKKYFWKGLLLLSSDLISLLLMVLSFMMLLDHRYGMGMKYFYAVFLIVDILYFVSGIYRYPVLIYNELKIGDAIAKGVLLTLNNIGHTFLILCVAFCLLIVSVLTGIGIILILPGGMFLLMIYAYKNILVKYKDNSDEPGCANVHDSAFEKYK